MIHVYVDGAFAHGPADLQARTGSGGERVVLRGEFDPETDVKWVNAVGLAVLYGATVERRSAG